MEAFALKHARPRALEAAKEAAMATVVPMPQRTQAPPRRAVPIADVVRCPWCDGAACDVKRDGVVTRECVWCGSQSKRTDTGWLLVGELGRHHG